MALIDPDRHADLIQLQRQVNEAFAAIVANPESERITSGQPSISPPVRRWAPPAARRAVRHPAASTDTDIASVAGRGDSAGTAHRPTRYGVGRCSGGLGPLA